jgi:hypothetical protein
VGGVGFENRGSLFLFAPFFVDDRNFHCITIARLPSFSLQFARVRNLHYSSFYQWNPTHPPTVEPMYSPFFFVSFTPDPIPHPRPPTKNNMNEQKKLRSGPARHHAVPFPVT